MKKVTSGPWQIAKISEFGADRDNFCITAEIKPNDNPTVVVAELYGNNWDPKEDWANAKLIAAAPELLDSLSELVNSPNAKQNAMWDRARKALEKAQGGTQ